MSLTAICVLQHDQKKGCRSGAYVSCSMSFVSIGPNGFFFLHILASTERVPHLVGQLLELCFPPTCSVSMHDCGRSTRDRNQKGPAKRKRKFTLSMIDVHVEDFSRRVFYWLLVYRAHTIRSIVCSVCSCLNFLWRTQQSSFLRDGRHADEWLCLPCAFLSAS